MTEPKLIGFIPARSGSKGVPFKNFRMMAGEHDPAYGRSLVGRVQYIAARCRLNYVVCLDRGAPYSGPDAESVLIRPDELATDTATVADLLKHYEQEFRKREATGVMVLYPTYALRTADDLAWIRYEWLKEPTRGLVGVVPSREPAHLLVYRTNDEVRAYQEHVWNQPNRQGYAQTWKLCLFACVVPVDQIKALPGQPIAPNSRALEIPAHKALDVDTWDDWHRAEEILCRVGS